MIGSETDTTTTSSGGRFAAGASSSSTRSNGTNGSTGPPINKLQSFLKAASVTQKFKTQLAGLMNVIEGG